VLSKEEQDRFDALLEAQIDALPPAIRSLLDECPIIVEDRPSRELLLELGENPDDEDVALEFYGLHTGVPFTEESVESSGEVPPEIRLFREGIIDLAGGWDSANDHETVREEIRITILHEIGHQFGLDEDDLDELGYQ
jgi:predicted Zn-dependent protease with MMP-like domain